MPLLVEVAFEVLVEGVLWSLDGVVLRLLGKDEFVKLIQVRVQVGEVELALELRVEGALHRLVCGSGEGLVAEAQVAAVEVPRSWNVGVVLLVAEDLGLESFAFEGRFMAT